MSALYLVLYSFISFILIVSHILAGTIKDTVTRYAHQTGHYVSRRFGWDCHGLPVEFEIDKKLNITGRAMVLEMGVDKYNAECRAIVTRYTAEWEKTITRLGRWIDFKNDYKTLDPEYMESVWWVFKTMFEKGLVYRGFKVMPYSTYCGTPLSNFEAGLNYKDVDDPAIVVSFPLVDDPETNLLCWTTTPWTLPSNLALCVNPSFTYVKIKDKTRDNKVFVLLEKRLCQIFPEVSKASCTPERKAELYEVIGHLQGSELVGKQYTPLFQYFVDKCPTAFRVCGDAYVTEEGGTGIVHNAPAFGEDDYRVCVAQGIIGKGEDLPCPVDSNGCFTEEVPEYKGRNVKEADQDICQALKGTGRMVLKEVYRHSYPFCWRSETPLIYKAVPSWFVSVETIKERLLRNNTQTNWVPSFVKDGRFHNWLADARDWAISRNRFWGTPIPLWVSDDLEEIVPIGSVDELYQLSGVKVDDLHKDIVDKITIPSKRGKGDLKRIDEVFDCWFESGSMPYAQLHYPFENSDRFENGFPADFIAEGLDQTRGWFYTLMVISTCLFDKPAFKNLIVNGLVLASDGKKMSKRLKNYPDPNIVVNSHGADALRLYLINSPVVRADVLKFQEEGVAEVVRGVFLPWFNAFRFFVQCVDRLEAASSANFVPAPESLYASSNVVDIWILAALQGLVEFVHQEMKAYRLYTVIPRLVAFIDELTKWYVRLNRARIKGEMGDTEAMQGLNVMYEVLTTMCQIMAPFTPFFTEYLYSQLRVLHPLYDNQDPAVPEDVFGKSKSVHFLILPEPKQQLLNPVAVSQFKTLQDAINLVRICRERRHIRNNLPIKNVIMVVATEADVAALEFLREYFVSEVNTWNMVCTTDWEKNCTLKVLPNWKDLGKRLGKQMKQVAQGVNDLTFTQIVDFMHSGSMDICGFTLTSDDIVVKREFKGDTKVFEAAVSDDGSLMVAVDTTVDEEMQVELRARAVVSAIQKLRKSSGLQVADVVEVFYEVEAGSKPTATTGAELKASLDMVQGALVKHEESTLKRLRAMPLPAAQYRPAVARVIASEAIEDADIVSKDKALRLYFTAPTVAVHLPAVQSLVGNSTQSAGIAAAFLQTMEYDSLMSLEAVSVSVVGEQVISLRRGVHFFATAEEMLKTTTSK